MPQTVVGLFDDRAHAERAVKAFLNTDFPSDRISIITADPRGEYVSERVDQHGNKAGAGAVTGATSGAVVGGIFGLLVGAGAIAFPPLGLVAAGPAAPLIAAAIGAGAGAVGGGLLGALIGLGIPKEHAHTYAEAIRRGGVLVTVEAHDADIIRANELMKRHGAVDVRQRAAYYQEQGFSQYDPSAPVYSEEEARLERERVMNYMGPSTGAVSGPPPMQAGMASTSTMDAAGAASYGTELQSRYQQGFANRGLAYENWEPAYRFGWQLRSDPRFQTGWANHEMEIRRQWEATQPGTWELYRDAVYAGWEDAHARTGARLM